MQLKEICPKCFAATGFSIVLEEEKGVYMCPKNALHKFRKSRDGFLEQYTL